MMARKCPIEDTIEFIARKWTLLILRNLQLRKKMRFSELLRELDGISSRTLATRLYDLKRWGMISKSIFPEIPLRVEYSLTEKGLEFGKAITDIVSWCHKWETGQGRV